MGTVVFVAIVFGVLAGFGGTLLAFWASQRGLITLGGEQTPSMASTGDTGSHLTLPLHAGGGSLPGFANVADAINESVVNINTRTEQTNPYSFFFGGGSEVVSGLGTGVVVSADGYIITNFHVAGEADKITVTIMHKDGKREYPATLIGGDKQEDVALIKIKAKGLKPVAFGDSNALRPGEWVMAMGNPFGFEHTVSVGVVSALNRQLPVDDAVTLKGMIQTDASINPGNSGGPLINTRGEVVGINTAVFVGRGNGQPQASGIGFSIPSNRVVRLMKELRQNKRVQHPYVGIRYELVTDDMRKSAHIPTTNGGVVVRGVYPGGPAAKVGIQKDDILTTIDGKPLTDQNVLGDIVSQKTVGARLNIELMRWQSDRNAWEKRAVTLTVEDMPKEFQKTMSQGSQQPQGEQQQPQQQQPQGGFPFPFPF